ncbi:MAG: tRNA 2-thiouridine(34) synthase MnmA [Deltaproteobacteria bacterium]|nr:MAG: tRNA 2-thiouridine(34) synthase MnmA [Deltaproteobacteria bacterium]
MKKRVVVAMSGGVDSSTAASILAKQGYEVIGVSMRLPNLGETSEVGCCGIRGIDDARNVAQKIGIPFYALNYEREFEDKVIDYLCREYENGRTPNPCIVCNEKVKLGSLLDKAKSLNADYLATGHYARIEYDKLSKRYLLKKGKDKAKDQSYFLFSLSQEQLSHSIFPLGDYTKSGVRRLAKEFGLKVHDKVASQEICFVPGNDYREFLRARVDTEKFVSGAIVNRDGKILGEHQGIAFYTIGQRKGIGAHKKPFYVTAIDKETNTVVIGEEKELFQDKLVAENVNWVDREKLVETTEVKARIRHKHPESEATIFPLNGGKVRVEFAQPQRAIAPGQAVVFYREETVVGGGWIA